MNKRVKQAIGGLIIFGCGAAAVALFTTGGTSNTVPVAQRDSGTIRITANSFDEVLAQLDFTYVEVVGNATE